MFDLSLPKGRSGRKRPCKGPQANELEKGLFPGRIGPGLIEASRTALSQTPMPPNFPGELARASLKRPYARRRATGARPNFPGELARASLKHDDDFE